MKDPFLIFAICCFAFMAVRFTFEHIDPWLGIFIGFLSLYFIINNIIKKNQAKQ